ncbi:methyltransferase domain-containing protein [Candidatus Poribacteria bacterium]|nr:methyltransferase domain-containing protein [Candidatus Poribacteria bacterium]
MSLYLRKLRAKKISNTVGDFIKKGSRILDIGSGDCIVAKQLQKDRDTDIICVDKIDYNKTDLPLITCKSDDLPFLDKSFDSVLLFFVLHHSKDYLKLLEEAERVCKGELIIIEDIYSNILERWFISLIDFLWNFRNSVATPFNFFTRQEWLSIFSQQSFLERGIILGAFFFLVGMALDIRVAWRWIQSGFGPLDEIRSALFALVFMVMGAQTVFSAFLLSLFSIPRHVNSSENAVNNVRDFLSIKGTEDRYGV